MFPSEESIISLISQRRSGGVARCSYCDSANIILREKMIYCLKCQKRGSVLVGTIFEHSKISLGTWLYLMLLMSNSSHTLPVSFVARHLGVTASSAFRMLACIRLHIEALHRGLVLGCSGEVIQVDETLIGSVKAGKGGGRSGAIVLGVYSSKGVVAQHIPNRRRETLFPLIQLHAAPGSWVATDQFRAYSSLSKLGFRHVSMNHGRREFVTAEGYSTVGIEGYWANLKFSLRSCNITPNFENLQPYLSEHAFKFSCRKRGIAPFEAMIADFPAIDFGKWSKRAARDIENHFSDGTEF